jgi:ABC-type cobalamin/Fe3+-siderophores transport system ATPase subunit
LSDLSVLKARITSARRSVDRRITEARMIAAQSQKLKSDIVLASHDVDLYNKVAITLASIGETRQADAQRTIEELVTRGIQSIFNDKSMVFHVTQTQRGKTPEIKFSVDSRGLNGRTVSTSVMDARGGGLAAVVGFLLRLVVLLLNKQVKEPILFLDEAFAHVSAEYEIPLAEFIKELISKTNVTVVLVTHSNAFSEFADVQYRTKLIDGVTQYDRI